MAAAAPPPTPTVEVIEVYAPRLAPLGGEAAFSAVQVGPEILKQTPRLDQALESAPGVSLFRRTTSLSANPTTQGVSLRAIAGVGFFGLAVYLLLDRLSRAAERQARHRP